MEGVLSSRPTPIDRMIWQAVTAVFTIFTLLPTSAFAGLDGINWHSEQDYISAHGRLELTSNNKFCTFIDKLECKVREPGKLPIYYLLECDRNRRICEAVSAKLLRGEPWLVKQEYRITEWDAGHVSASIIIFDALCEPNSRAGGSSPSSGALPRLAAWA